MDKNGFTLVELMVVVVIIGILVAIIVPIYGKIQDNAAIKAHEANLRTIDGAISMFQAEFGGSIIGYNIAPSDRIYGKMVQVGNSIYILRGTISFGGPAVAALVAAGYLTDPPVIPQRLIDKPELLWKDKNVKPDFWHDSSNVLYFPDGMYGIWRGEKGPAAFPVAETEGYRAGDRIVW